MQYEYVLQRCMECGRKTKLLVDVGDEPFGLHDECGLQSYAVFGPYDNPYSILDTRLETNEALLVYLIRQIEDAVRYMSIPRILLRETSRPIL